MRLSGFRLMVCVSCEQTTTSHPPTGMDHSPLFSLSWWSILFSKNKPFVLEFPSVRYLVTNENVPWTLIESPITSKLLWLWLFLHFLHVSSFLMPAYLYKNCLIWHRCTVSGVHYLEHNSEREIFLYWLRYLMFMNVSQWWNPQVHISH